MLKIHPNKRKVPPTTQTLSLFYDADFPVALDMTQSWCFPLTWFFMMLFSPFLLITFQQIYVEDSISSTLNCFSTKSRKVIWQVFELLLKLPPTIGACMFYSGDPRSQIFSRLKINPLTGICGEHFPMSENYPAVRIICSSHPGKGGLDAAATLRGRTQRYCKATDAVLPSPPCREPFSFFSRI